MKAKLLTQGQLLGYPENFGVKRFKLAMWKVNGIEIETTAGRQKNSPKQNGSWGKTEFFRAANRKQKEIL